MTALLLLWVVFMFWVGYGIVTYDLHDEEGDE